MPQPKHEQPAEKQWEVEVSAPTVPLTPKGPPPAPAPPAPPALPQVDPQGETLLPDPPPKAPVLISPSSDRTSRAHRARTLSPPRQKGQGPSNLTLAILWTIALLSVCAAVAYFVLSS